MDRGSLEQLELLRRLAVERERSGLAAARATYDALRSRRVELCERRAARERELRSARAAFATAATVAELRRAQAFLGEASAADAEIEAELAALTQRCRSAAEQVRAAQRALTDARVGERSVQRVRARQANEVSRRTSLREEELADELFRARSGRE